jgi:thiol-disulfide isomerase/thioredoxin
VANSNPASSRRNSLRVAQEITDIHGSRYSGVDDAAQQRSTFGAAMADDASGRAPYRPGGDIGRTIFCTRRVTSAGFAAKLSGEPTTASLGDTSNMLLKSLKTLIAIAFLAGSALTAQAGQPFDTKAFQQAQAAGKPILVDVTAPWCPTCKVQRPIVQQIEKSTPNLVVYEVDFDSAKDVLKRFRVQSQSTLIVFKGANEVGRSTGDTNPASIKALVSKGL